MADQHDLIVQHLRAAYGDQPSVVLPPKVAGEIGFRYQRYDEKKALSAILPALDRFADATGNYQSGMVVTAMDLVFSALATLLADRPCTLVTHEVTHLRALAADGKVFKVEARLRALRSSMVFLEARADNWEGKPVAMATATLAVYKSRKG